MIAQDIIKKLLYASRKNRKKLLEEVSDPEELLTTLFYYLDIYIWLRNEEGIKKIISLSDLFLKIYYTDRIAFRIFSKQAHTYETLKKYADAIKYYEKIYQDSYKMGNEMYLAEALMKNGAFFERMGRLAKIPLSVRKIFPKTQNPVKGILNKAIGYFSEAEFLYSLSEKTYNHFAAVFNIAFINHRLGRIEDAFDSCISILNNDALAAQPTLLANTNLLLANIYEERNNKLMSKIHYEKSLALFQQSGNQLKVSEILHKMAWLFARQKKFMQAEKLYRKALDIKVSLDYKQSLGDFYFNRGFIMKECGHKDFAVKFFDRALFVSEILNDTGKSLYIKFQIFEIIKEKNSLYTLSEFLQEYSPPVSKEILGATIHPSYAVRAGEDGALRPYSMPEMNFKIDRKTMKNMFAELTHLFKINRDEKRSAYFMKQYTALSSILTPKEL